MLNNKVIGSIENMRLASRNMPIIWDGKNAILEMKKADYKPWRQQRWIKWYFKFLCGKYYDNIIDIPCNDINIVNFDAFSEIKWDFKVDSVDAVEYSVIANDAKSIKDTISDFDYYGMVLALGDMEYDDAETSFKKWHDKLCRKVNKYETNKINKGVMSRIYQTSFVLKEIRFICFDSDTLHQCCGLIQNRSAEKDYSLKRNVRNVVVIDINKIPDVALVSSETFLTG